MSPDLTTPQIRQRASELLGEQFAALNLWTNRWFAALLGCQWVAGVLAAVYLSPGAASPVQLSGGAQLALAILGGGVITAVPIYLTIKRPDATSTRHAIAAAQMAWSGLLIQLAGEGLETHFHVFGSLALLACYRDWRVLATAAAVVAGDQFVRGWFWPPVLDGVGAVSTFRTLAQAGWFLIEAAFLVIAIHQRVREMTDLATKQARLELTNVVVESEVRERTRELHDYTHQLETARRAMEEQTAAMALQARDLQEARASAESANRAKSQFLATMSHEIRTPLTAVLGFADMLLTDLSGSEVTRAAKTIKRNGEFLLKIVNDILDLSKIEAGKLTIECMPCSPRQIVADVETLMRVRSDAKGLPLAIEFAGPIPETIVSDPTRVRQILVNVLGNAIKFSHQGEIRLRTQLTYAADNQPLLRFTVTDHGIGMTGQQAAEAFQPFAQATASTTREFGGTGLGLTISKCLAEMLGGTIEINSVAGQGTQVGVTVATGPLDPLKLLAEPAEVLTTDAASPTLYGQAVLDCHVLLADDSPDNRELVTFVLQRSGAQVATTENGARAVEMALAAIEAGNPYDVVLMDMQMPVLDGLAATRELRSRGYTGPIIALTAHAMREDLERCLAAGCDACATKPIDARLLSLVERYSRAGGTPSVAKS